LKVLDKKFLSLLCYGVFHHKGANMNRHPLWSSPSRHGDTTERLLRRIIRQLEAIMVSQTEVNAKLDAVLAGVAEESTAIGSIEQVLVNLEKEIADLKAAAENAGVSDEIVGKIDALGQAVGANRDRILADVEANTHDAG
jgi:hypothetical protein